MIWTEILSGLLISFNYFVLFYFFALNSIYLLLFLISLKEVRRFVRRTFFSDYRQILNSEMTWPVSVLVPAHNEALTIVQTIRSLLILNYSEFEVIVINDGSTDATLHVLAEAFELRPLDQVYRRSLETGQVRGVFGSLTIPNLKVIDKVRGGKSDALNAGINLSRYPLICSIDADSVIEENALLRVVKPFMEHPEETVAGGGIVRIANGCEFREGRLVRIGLPDRPLAIFQVVEYLRAFLTGRVGWSALQSLLIISGAFGIYRKDLVIEMGGYARDTDSEDLELVVRLHAYLRHQKRKYRVVFVPDPVCWTECPATLRVLNRQRDRWHRGLVQTLWLHRFMLLRPRYGVIGMFALPYFLLFEMLGPFVEIMGYLAVVLAWMLGTLNQDYLALFVAVALVYGIFLSVAAVLLEELSFRRYPGWMDLFKLLVFSVLENLGYRQLLALFKVRAFFHVTRRRPWGRMDRRGFRQAHGTPPVLKHEQSV